VGYERSERRETDAAASYILATCRYTLKHKQPLPSPPLLSQGRGRITASMLELVPHQLKITIPPGSEVTFAP
jgi:hypothetical protein